MPDPVTGIIAGTSVIGGISQSKANKKATKAQQQAADASIAEQRRQFDAYQALLRPYVDAGTPALRGLMDLAGLGTPSTNWTAYAQSNPELMAAYQAQQQAIPSGGAGAPYGLGDSPGMGYQPMQDMFLNPNAYASGNTGNVGPGRYGMMAENYATQGGGGAPVSLEQFAQQWQQQRGGDVSQFTTDPQAAAVARIEGQPMFSAIARQGEDAILQNASATGGLRGGNTQGALARFRPELLNQFIQQQYARLAGITELGQNAAAGVGGAGLSTGANIGNLLTQRGQATAAGAGAQGQIFSNMLGGVSGAFTGGFMPRGPQASLLGSVQNTMNQNPGLF